MMMVLILLLLLLLLLLTLLVVLLVLLGIMRTLQVVCDRVKCALGVPMHEVNVAIPMC
jgi:hypothetical protein